MTYSKKTDAAKAADSIKKLEDKDGEPNNESARTNELLAARDGGDDSDPAKASIELNDPSKSRNAYTSHESGFNEDLAKDDTDTGVTKSEGQTKTVNKADR